MSNRSMDCIAIAPVSPWSALVGRAVAYAGSPCGTIMLSPSTAPRWKTATRTLPRASAAAAVLTRNRGGPASATSEHAPDFKKIRRFIACLLSPLELWGPEDQRGEFGDVGVRGAAVVRAQARELWVGELRRKDRARLCARLAGDEDGERPVQQ